MFKKISLIAVCTLYIGAGINHFWHPKSYVELIPPYFPDRVLLNYVSGILEMIAGLLMIIPPTRKIAAYLIIGLLIAFIPTHIYWIQMHGCVSIYLCTPAWLAWLRFFPFQFILIWWAWKTYVWNKPAKVY